MSSEQRARSSTEMTISSTSGPLSSTRRNQQFLIPPDPVHPAKRPIASADAPRGIIAAAADASLLTQPTPPIDALSSALLNPPSASQVGVPREIPENKTPPLDPAQPVSAEAPRSISAFDYNFDYAHEQAKYAAAIKTAGKRVKFISWVTDIISSISLIVGAILRLSISNTPIIPFVAAIFTFLIFSIARLCDYLRIGQRKNSNKSGENAISKEIAKVKNLHIEVDIINTPLEQPKPNEKKLHIKLLPKGKTQTQAFRANRLYTLIITSTLIQSGTLLLEILKFIGTISAPWVVIVSTVLTAVAIMGSRIIAEMEERHYSGLAKGMRWALTNIQILGTFNDYPDAQTHYLNKIKEEQQRTAQLGLTPFSEPELLASPVRNIAHAPNSQVHVTVFGESPNAPPTADATKLNMESVRLPGTSPASSAPGTYALTTTKLFSAQGAPPASALAATAFQPENNYRQDAITGSPIISSTPLSAAKTSTVDTLAQINIDENESKYIIHFDPPTP